MVRLILGAAESLVVGVLDWGLVRTPGEGVFGMGNGSWDGWLVGRTGQGWDAGWIFVCLFIYLGDGFLKVLMECG